MGRGHQRAEIARRQNEIGAHHRRFALGQHRIARRFITIAGPCGDLPIFLFGGKILFNNGREIHTHLAENGYFFGHMRFSTSSTANSVTLL